MRAGKSRSEIVASWGITYSRFNEWLDAYPELAEAYAVGKPAFDAYYKQALRDSSFGVARSVRENSLFFMLKNQAGFEDSGGGHEFADAQTSELEFVDDNDQSLGSRKPRVIFFIYQAQKILKTFQLKQKRTLGGFLHAKI